METLIFDGVMKPGTGRDLEVSEPRNMAGGTYCETEAFDLMGYKKIESIKGGFF